MTVTAEILDPLLRADPAGPRITYYDDATGERIELSTVTLLNWANQTGNLLRDDRVVPQGICRGADVDGALLVHTAAGLERCLSGDLSLRAL